MSLHSLGCMGMGVGVGVILGVILGVVYSPADDEILLFVCAGVLMFLGMVVALVRHPHIVGK